MRRCFKKCSPGIATGYEEEHRRIVDYSAMTFFSITVTEGWPFRTTILRDETRDLGSEGRLRSTA
jgi:hypothetical protein